jgi:parallel beta-helix repeat protein
MTLRATSTLTTRTTTTLDYSGLSGTGVSVGTNGVLTVSTLAQLNAALAVAKPGARIELAAGDYGDLVLQNRSFSSAVTIAAKDPANPPTFGSVSLWKVTNLTFDTVEIDFRPTATTVDWSSALRTDFCSGITLRNSVVEGGVSVAGISPDAPAGTQGASGILGYPIGVGLTFNNSSNILVENNTITEFGAGIRFGNASNIRILDNEVSDFRKVAVGGNATNVRIEDNYFHDANPWKLGGAGDHSDFIHLWTTSTQVGPSANITIADNHLSQGGGPPIIGIYLDDNTNNKGFQTVLVENNVIHSGAGQAMRMEDVVGLTIRSNTVVQTLGTGSVTPSIVLAEGTRDVLVTDNIMAGLVGAALTTAGANIRVTGNLTAQVADSQAANYIGNILLNALTPQATLDGFRPVPGGPAAGFGAEVPLQGKGIVFIASSGGGGLDMDTLGFSLGTLAGPQGSVDLTGAKVSWSFGDGTAAAGARVAHDYDSFGLHQVTARVTLKDGTQLLVQKTAQVTNPVALTEDFDGAFTSSVALLNGAQLVAGPDGDLAVRALASGATAKFATEKPMTQNSEFTISFDFRKDPGAEAVGGRALYFSGTAVIDVGANSITLQGSTNLGEKIVLTASNIGINDSDWHRVTYAFSKSDGTAILYVDGTEIDRIEGLQGGQQVTNGHNLHLGNPFGKGFTGLLDNPVFLRDSVDPDDGSALLAAPADGGSPFLADSFTSHQQAWTASGYALF